jgi:hypothetical protein
MKSKDLFWPGFVGLLTIMFVIMLVLFGLSFKVYTEKTKVMVEQNTRLRGIEKEYVYIKRRNRQTESFRSDTVFEYLPSCDKYIIKSLRGKDIFVANKSDLKDKYLKEILTSGHVIESYLNKIDKDEWTPSFILIIEGYMGNGYDNISGDPSLAYQTSYQRALGVYQLWEKAGIVFQKQKVEILFSGRGFDGICRDNKRRKINFLSIRFLSRNNF